MAATRTQPFHIILQDLQRDLEKKLTKLNGYLSGTDKADIKECEKIMSFQRSYFEKMFDPMLMRRGTEILDGEQDRRNNFLSSENLNFRHQILRSVKCTDEVLEKINQYIKAHCNPALLKRRTGSKKTASLQNIEIKIKKGKDLLKELETCQEIIQKNLASDKREFLEISEYLENCNKDLTTYPHNLLKSIATKLDKLYQLNSSTETLCSAIAYMEEAFLSFNANQETIIANDPQYKFRDFTKPLEDFIKDRKNKLGEKLGRDRTEIDTLISKEREKIKPKKDVLPEKLQEQPSVEETKENATPKSSGKQRTKKKKKKQATGNQDSEKKLLEAVAEVKHAHVPKHSWNDPRSPAFFSLQQAAKIGGGRGPSLFSQTTKDPNIHGIRFNEAPNTLRIKHK